MLFDANAIVWAEEPDSIVALWKQRLRWGRGNLQITAAFARSVVQAGTEFASGRSGFGVLWFSVALMPLFMLCGSGRPGRPLLSLDAVGAEGLRLVLGRDVRHLSVRDAVLFAIDPADRPKCWFEGLAFPGLLSVAVMRCCLVLKPFTGRRSGPAPHFWSWGYMAAQFVLGWTAISTLAAWAVYRLDKAGAPKWLRNPLLVLFGYGPLLCAIACGAIVAQLRKPI